MNSSRRLLCAAAAAGSGTTTAAATAAAATSSVASASPSGEGGVTTQATAALRTLYRRLLKAGEEGAMMQHCLSVHTVEQSATYGVRLLRLHRGLATVDAAARQTPWWRCVKRTRQGLARRYYAWSLFYLRLTLRSWNAISDMLVYILFLTMCVFVYEIYRTCRVGVDRAQERYRTMAIPIVQTFDALEAAQQRKKILRTDLEEDIVRDR